MNAYRLYGFWRNTPESPPITRKGGQDWIYGERDALRETHLNEPQGKLRRGLNSLGKARKPKQRAGLDIRRGMSFVKPT